MTPSENKSSTSLTNSKLNSITHLLDSKKKKSMLLSPLLNGSQIQMLKFHIFKLKWRERMLPLRSSELNTLPFLHNRLRLMQSGRSQFSPLKPKLPTLRRRESSTIPKPKEETKRTPSSICASKSSRIKSEISSPVPHSRDYDLV